MKTLDEVIEKCQGYVDDVAKGWDKDDCFLSYDDWFIMFSLCKTFNMVKYDKLTERNIMINLTKDEAYAVADLIYSDLFDRIRNDTEIDSMEWLINIIHAYEKLCEYSDISDYKNTK